MKQGINDGIFLMRISLLQYAAYKNWTMIMWGHSPDWYGKMILLLKYLLYLCHKHQNAGHISAIAYNVSNGYLLTFCP